MNLQEKIQSTEEYGTVYLEFDEYVGSLVIDKPIQIDGQNSTICSQHGPVITIAAEDVKLQNLRIELIASDSHPPQDQALALLVKDHFKVDLYNTIVRGNVAGIVHEDGVWEYPDTLHLHPVVPETPNYFVFEMNVPINCVLETDIEGLNILDPGLMPGKNTVRLEVAPLKPGTILFGDIEIRSMYLKRLISVSGGTFALPEKVKRPDPNAPVQLATDTPLPSSPSPSSTLPDSPPKKTAFPVKSIMGWLAAVFAVVLFTWGAWNLWPFIRTNSPTLSLVGMQDAYKVGDVVSVTTEAQSDKPISQLTFTVKTPAGMTVDEITWQLNSPTVEKAYLFETSGWPPRRYRYILSAQDEKGNTAEKKGHFLLKPLSREVKVTIIAVPSVEIFIGNKSYGYTPKANLPLSSGEIRIQFLNKSKNINLTKTYNIPKKPRFKIHETF